MERKNKMRKRFFGKKLATSALALLLATSVALSGCGKSNKSDNTKEKPANDKTTEKIKIIKAEITAVKRNLSLNLAAK